MEVFLWEKEERQDREEFVPETLNTACQLMLYQDIEAKHAHTQPDVYEKYGKGIMTDEMMGREIDFDYLATLSLKILETETEQVNNKGGDSRSKPELQKKKQKGEKVVGSKQARRYNLMD